MLNPLPSLFPNLLGTSSSPRIEFYDKFQREADEYDRDLMKKYDEDLNTTLIFVSHALVFVSATAFILFNGVYRPVCSPQLLPLSSSMPRTTFNRNFEKQATVSPGLLPMSRQGTIQPAQLLLSLNGTAQTPTWSTQNPSFTLVWSPPSSLRPLRSWASNGSTVTLRSKCAHPLSIVVVIDNGR